MPPENIAPLKPGGGRAPASKLAPIIHKIQETCWPRIPMMYKVLMDIAEDPKASRSDRMKAATYIIDRAEGKVPTKAVAPADDHSAPQSAGTVQEALKGLVGQLTPAAVDALKTLIVQDLKNQGKLEPDATPTKEGGVS